MAMKLIIFVWAFSRIADGAPQFYGYGGDDGDYGSYFSYGNYGFRKGSAYDSFEDNSEERIIGFPFINPGYYGTKALRGYVFYHYNSEESEETSADLSPTPAEFYIKVNWEGQRTLDDQRITDVNQSDLSVLNKKAVQSEGLTKSDTLSRLVVSDGKALTDKAQKVIDSTIHSDVAKSSSIVEGQGDVGIIQSDILVVNENAIKSKGFISEAPSDQVAVEVGSSGTSSTIDTSNIAEISLGSVVMEDIPTLKVQVATDAVQPNQADLLVSSQKVPPEGSAKDNTISRLVDETVSAGQSFTDKAQNVIDSTMQSGVVESSATGNPQTDISVIQPDFLLVNENASKSKGSVSDAFSDRLVVQSVSSGSSSEVIHSDQSDLSVSNHKSAQSEGSAKSDTISRLVVKTISAGQGLTDKTQNVDSTLQSDVGNSFSDRVVVHAVSSGTSSDAIQSDQSDFSVSKQKAIDSEGSAKSGTLSRLEAETVSAGQSLTNKAQNIIDAVKSSAIVEGQRDVTEIQPDFSLANEDAIKSKGSVSDAFSDRLVVQSVSSGSSSEVIHSDQSDLSVSNHKSAQSEGSAESDTISRLVVKTISAGQGLTDKTQNVDSTLQSDVAESRAIGEGQRQVILIQSDFPVVKKNGIKSVSNQKAIDSEGSAESGTLSRLEAETVSDGQSLTNKAQNIIDAVKTSAIVEGQRDVRVSQPDFSVENENAIKSKGSVREAFSDHVAVQAVSSGSTSDVIHPDQSDLSVLSQKTAHFEGSAKSDTLSRLVVATISAGQGITGKAQSIIDSTLHSNVAKSSDIVEGQSDVSVIDPDFFVTNQSAIKSKGSVRDALLDRMKLQAVSSGTSSGAFQADQSDLSLSNQKAVDSEGSVKGNIVSRLVVETVSAGQDLTDKAQNVIDVVESSAIVEGQKDVSVNPLDLLVANVNAIKSKGSVSEAFSDHVSVQAVSSGSSSDVIHSDQSDLSVSNQKTAYSEGSAKGDTLSRLVVGTISAGEGIIGKTQNVVDSTLQSDVVESSAILDGQRHVSNIHTDISGANENSFKSKGSLIDTSRTTNSKAIVGSMGAAIIILPDFAKGKQIALQSEGSSYASYLGLLKTQIDSTRKESGNKQNIFDQTMQSVAEEIGATLRGQGAAIVILPDISTSNKNAVQSLNSPKSASIRGEAVQTVPAGQVPLDMVQHVIDLLMQSITSETSPDLSVLNKDAIIHGESASIGTLQGMTVQEVSAGQVSSNAAKITVGLPSQSNVIKSGTILDAQEPANII